MTINMIYGAIFGGILGGLCFVVLLNTVKISNLRSELDKHLDSYGKE
jgi:hypothetical protein